SPNDLKNANRLAGNKLIPGKQIIIPTHQPIRMAFKTAENKLKINPGDTVYMIRKGDTIEKIAKKFKIAASSIRLSNLIDNDLLNVGEEIIIPTHYRG